MRPNVHSKTLQMCMQGWMMMDVYGVWSIIVNFPILSVLLQQFISCIYVRIFLYRREHRPSAAFSLSTDLDADILDLDDQLSPPSSFYTGTGGKPPLSFSLSDPKPPKRLLNLLDVVKSISVYRSFICRGSFSQSTSLFADVDGDPPGDWMGFVDPNEPRYCLCNQVTRYLCVKLQLDYLSDTYVPTVT